MYRRFSMVFLITGALALSVASCKKKAAPAAAPESAAKAPATEGAHAKAGQAAKGEGGGGPSVGGNVEMETANGKKWAAVKKAQVKVGQEVAIAGAMLMKDFTSKSLDRTFEEIYFGSLAGDKAMGEAGKMPPGHPPTASAGKAAMVHGEGGGAGQGTSGAKKQPQMDVGDPLEKAAGPDGRTVAEVFKQGGELSGKPVSVRGKVVKVNKGILGRNWVHLQDGTGSADTGDHDLTLTTKEDAKLGEVVVAKGTLATDKDFGSGYKYAVILEDVTFTR